MSIPLYDGREVRFRLELFHHWEGNEDELILVTLDELEEVYEKGEWDEEFEDEESGMYNLARRKEHSMKTFEELKALLTQDLLELEQLAGNWTSTIEERHVKEQQIGRQCYQTAP